MDHQPVNQHVVRTNAPRSEANLSVLVTHPLDTPVVNPKRIKLEDDALQVPVVDEATKKVKQEIHKK
jgi:hypothetical protein